MRIAYVYDAVYPWETGGVQKRVWEFARRLADRHDVHWFGLHYWDGARDVEREGVTLHGVGSPRDLYVDGRRSISEAFSFAAALRGTIRGREFDVVDCQVFPYFSCFTSTYETLDSDTSLLLTWHEVWGRYWWDYLGWKGVFGQGVERLTAALPVDHVAVSERTRRDLRSIGGSDVRLVPNGIDAEEVERAPPVDRDVDVLFVGRLIEEKNAALLVRAVAALATARPDVQCVLVGEGPERDRLEALVSALGLGDSVTMLDRLDSHEEVLGLMKTAEVFALPSRREGFGITALEALACGTPVVTIDHPQNATADLVEDGVTGVVTDPTPEALATGVRVASRLSAADCVAAAARYDWDALTDRVEAVYREATTQEQVGVGPPEVA